MNSNPIVIAKSRDFGELLGDSIQFFIKNFKELATALLLTVGPIYLITGILQGIYSSNMMGMMGRANEIGEQAGASGNLDPLWDFYGELFSGTYIMSMLLTFIGMALGIAVVNNFMILYHEKGNVAPSLDEIRGKAFSDVPGNLGALFVSGIIIGLGSMFCFLPGVFVWVPLMLMCIVMQKEGLGVFESISRSFKLNKGHWWQSFGLYFVLYFIVSFVGSIIASPILIGMFSSVAVEDSIFASKAFMAGAGIIASLGQGILISVVMIAVVLQYYNLSGEKGDFSFDSQIDEIGGDE